MSTEDLLSCRTEDRTVPVHLSFEAEYLLFTVPRLPHTAESNFQLCKGVVSDRVPDIQLGQPSVHAPEEVLVELDKMADEIKTRPAFADLFLKANDKLAFVKRVKPHLWVASEQHSAVAIQWGPLRGCVLHAGGCISTAAVEHMLGAPRA